MTARWDIRQKAIRLGYEAEPITGARFDVDHYAKGSQRIAIKFSPTHRVTDVVVNGQRPINDGDRSLKYRGRSGAENALADHCFVMPENIDDLRAMPAPAAGAPYEQRAAFNAMAALVAYSDRRTAGEDEFQSMLGDLVADLMHLCDGLGIDADAVIDSGRDHHTDEKI